ncbi:MAG TPA: alpha/beta hydrolase [Rhodothermales bacterium]|nr:alpha/beta hydrolase [Rhodothermales bacterium]
MTEVIPREPRVRHLEDRFRAADGLWLFRQSWLPATPSRAVVVLVHGYAEHSGRYAEVAACFAERKLAVTAYDQRGYGRSEGKRASIASFDEYVSDLDTFVGHVRQTHSDLPLMLLGHSMGGLIAAAYSIRHRPPVRGLVLSSPAVQTAHHVPPVLRGALTFLARFFPTLPTIRIKASKLAHDQDTVQVVRHDALNYRGRLPARTGAEMVKTGQFVLDHADALRFPLLIIQGTEDRIVEPAGSMKLFQRAGSRDKTLRLYRGLYHETFNEPARKVEVLRGVSDWIVQHA